MAHKELDWGNGDMDALSVLLDGQSIEHDSPVTNKDTKNTHPNQHPAVQPNLFMRDDNAHTTELETIKFLKANVQPQTDQEDKVEYYNYRISGPEKADSFLNETLVPMGQNEPGDIGHMNIYKEQATGEQAAPGVSTKPVQIVVNKVTEQPVSQVTTDHGGRALYTVKPGGATSFRNANIKSSSIGTTAAKFSYGTVLIDSIPKEVIKRIKDFQKQIPKELFSHKTDADGWVEKGKQKNFHITVLYGMSDDSYKYVKELYKVRNLHKPYKLRLGEVTYFDNRDKGKDVALIVKVENPDGSLKAAHDILKENTDNQDTYSDFKPHLTIGFLKDLPPKELLGKKLVGSWTTDGLLFSNPAGDIKKLAIKQQFSFPKHSFSALTKESSITRNGHAFYYVGDFTVKGTVFARFESSIDKEAGRVEDGVTRRELGTEELNRYRQTDAPPTVEDEETRKLKEEVKKEKAPLMAPLPKNLKWDFLEDNNIGQVFYHDLEFGGSDLADMGMR